MSFHGGVFVIILGIIIVVSSFIYLTLSYVNEQKEKKARYKKIFYTVLASV